MLNSPTTLRVFSTPPKIGLNTAVSQMYEFRFFKPKALLGSNHLLRQPDPIFNSMLCLNWCGQHVQVQEKM